MEKFDVTIIGSLGGNDLIFGEAGNDLLIDGVIAGGNGNDKIKAREDAGIHVVDSPADIGEAMIKALGR